MYYLSIISPFYNSATKCQRLLSTLSNIKDNEIQIILVDDGSTDNTATLLNEFKQNSDIDVVVIIQENKGPGGARNSGLRSAQGEYIWFVDSDDDIKLDALPIIKQNLENNYDFIDFNYNTQSDVNRNSMNVSPGIYKINTNNRELILNNFGRIWTKVFRREFITQNNIYYPEYSIYEDNPLTMVYPLITERFLKSQLVAYDYLEEFPSITRSKPGPRYFDRLYTSIYGLKRASSFANNQAEQEFIERRFSFLYLNTITDLASLIPSKNWLVTHKVLKQYRLETKKLGVRYKVQEIIPHQSFKYRTYFLLQWYLSYLVLGDQTDYFESIRYKAWGKPFEY